MMAVRVWRKDVANLYLALAEVLDAEDVLERFFFLFFFFLFFYWNLTTNLVNWQCSENCGITSDGSQGLTAEEGRRRKTMPGVCWGVSRHSAAAALTQWIWAMGPGIQCSRDDDGRCLTALGPDEGSPNSGTLRLRSWRAGQSVKCQQRRFPGCQSPAQLQPIKTSLTSFRDKSPTAEEMAARLGFRLKHLYDGAKELVKPEQILHNNNNNNNNNNSIHL